MLPPKPLKIAATNCLPSHKTLPWTHVYDDHLIELADATCQEGLTRTQKQLNDSRIPATDPGLRSRTSKLLVVRIPQGLLERCMSKMVSMQEALGPDWFGALDCKFGGAVGWNRAGREAGGKRERERERVEGMRTETMELSSVLQPAAPSMFSWMWQPRSLVTGPRSSLPTLDYHFTWNARNELAPYHVVCYSHL